MDEAIDLDIENALGSDVIFLSLKRRADADPAKGRVEAYFFDICLPDGMIVGDCDLRVGHNENTAYGGNIGYEVYEPYRGHRYAAKACILLFRLARAKGMTQLLITCDPENMPSRRTCERLGGEYKTTVDIPDWHEMYQDGKRKVRIYRFALDVQKENAVCMI